MHFPFYAGEGNEIVFWEIKEKDKERIFSIVHEKIKGGHKKIIINTNQVFYCDSDSINILRKIRSIIQDNNIQFVHQGPNHIQKWFMNDSEENISVRELVNA